MAPSRNQGEDEPTLFDLPLKQPREPASEAEREEERRPDPATRRSPSERTAPREPAPSLPLGEPPDLRIDPEAEAPPEPTPQTAEQPAAERVVETRAPGAPGAGDPPPLSVRFLAGLADLGVHLALAVALLFGARLLGASAGLGDWIPLALFLLAFSFLYTVPPLAFWGRTPGMAWAGLEARATDGGGLTVGQTVRRWMGGLLTTALLGLPVLLAAGGGTSLADRLSESRSRLADQ